MIRFRGLIAPTEVPTGDGRMFATGKMTHRPMPLPVMARFGSGGHDGATPVAKIEKIYPGPGGYWAEGCFLDPMHVPEVPKAVYMIQERVMGPSVDLDRDFTVKMVPHPVRPDKKAGMFEEYNVIGMTLVPMPAFHQVYMSIDTAEEKTLLASAGVDVDRLILGNLDEITMEAPSLEFAASLESTHEAECGCNGDDDSDEFSQGIVPEGNVSVMGAPVSTTYTVGTPGALVPTTITVSFNQPMGMGPHSVSYPMMPMTETAASEQPVAVVKVLEDKTVVKVPHPAEDKEQCYFDEDGNCPVCGY